MRRRGLGLSDRVGTIAPCSSPRSPRPPPQVAATSARSVKIALIADCLRDAEPDEVVAAVAYLSGELLQRRTGVGLGVPARHARTGGRADA